MTTAPQPTARSSLAAPPRVAIVAVHGVGTPAPGATAEAIGHLLLAGTATVGPAVRQFETEHVHIPLAPVRVGDDDVTAEPGGDGEGWRWLGTLQRRFGNALEVATLMVSPRVARTTTERPNEDLHHRVMRYLLAGYRPPEPATAHRTTRLRGRVPGDSGDVEVHVYELYWADLSKGTRWLDRALQLLHLPWRIVALGRRTLEYATLEHRESRLWRLYRLTVAACGWLLTLPIPLLNLALAWVMLTPLPLMVPEAWRLPVAVSVVALGVVVVLGVAAYRFAPSPTLGWCLGCPVAGGAVAALALVWAVHPSLDAIPTATAGLVLAGLTPRRLLALEWLVVGWGLLALLARAFNPVRPGFLLGTHAVMGLATLHVLSTLFVAGTVGSLRGRLVATAERLLEAIFLCWLLVLVLAVAVGLGALVAPAVTRTLAGSARARRAVWTSSLALGVSLVFLELLQSLAFRTLFPPEPPPYLLQRRRTGGLADLFDFFSTWRLIPSLFEDLTAAVPLTATAFCVLGFVLLAWTLVPSLRYEIGPLVEGRPDAPLEGWLSQGLRAVGVLGTVAFLLAVPVPLLMVGFLFGPSGGAAEAARDFYTRFNAWFWTVVTAGVVGVAGLSLRFAGVGRALWPVFGIVLDVSAYLQDLPRERTPRARMIERFASLLRYVYAWPGPDGQGYAGVIFVTHSQGSVLTVDTLRFLRRQAADPRAPADLAGRPPMPLSLVTMGSPLRQIYAGAFPHLYRWVGAADSGVAQGSGTQVSDLTGTPAELGVRAWTNLYRTGDYIGRDLWPPVDPMLPRELLLPREDVCIGSGAHTRYFESRTVGGHLYRLLREHVGLRVT